MDEAESTVRELIRKLLEENNWKQKDLQIMRVPFQGANYTSCLFNVTLTTDTKVLELFAKVGNMSGQIRQEMNADCIFQTERVVYTKLFKVYEALQDKYKVPDEHRLVLTKCYAFEAELGKETVLMENLSLKGFKEWNRFDSMSWEHAAVSMEILAKFHALSFAYAKDHPEEFEKVATDMVYRMWSPESKNEKMIGAWKVMTETALKVLPAEHRAKLRPILLDENFLYQYHKPIGKPVLVHGDYRLNNLLFRRKGKTLEGIPLDFQLVHSGCVVEDLFFFIFLGSDEEFRKLYYHKLLNHYYEHLCQALRRLGLDPVETYPRETFDAHTQQMLPFALFLSVFFLPLLMVDTSKAPRTSDNVELKTLVLEPTPEFTIRFQGIVNDLIKWGAI